MTDVKLPPLPEEEYYGEGYQVVDLIEYARLAVLQERERCAKVCKDIRYNKAGIFYEGYDEGCDDCADAIRKGE